ncbi:amino acid ABC transporter permease [Castellaniella sp.]|uniref:amino acid ABC transporter permease n=1 Tax=Castellaniella sp. TaxID=1955812 RepID=UPI00355D9E6A
MISSYEAVLSHLPFLLMGIPVTLGVSLTAIVLGSIGGMLLNLMMLTRNRSGRYLARAYISIFRGTPVLLQLLVVYYVPGSMGFDIKPFPAAMLALALNTAAYQAEIYRGGFSLIPKGHMEAAKVLGISHTQAFLRIQVPQVYRLVMPSLFNELILVLKASSLVSIISVVDLTRRAQEIVSATQLPIEIYIITGIIYILINMAIARIGLRIEKTMGVYNR